MISDAKDTKIIIQQKRGRGRPRKNQVMSDIDKIKKDKQINSIKKYAKEIIDNDHDDEIILHLPITYKDITTIKNNNTLFDKKTDSSSNKQDTNIFTINDINSEPNSDSENNDLKKKIFEQTQIIKNLEKELSNYKNLLTDNSAQGVNNRKVTKMNMELIDTKTGAPIICEKTDIVCWWCTYNFDTVPCFLPEKFIDNKFYVFGCFCTFNCAAAYNLNLNDSYIWNRYSLLKKLYYLIFKINDDIHIAPPREIFKKFGGPLSYEDFKKNCAKCLKEYRFIMPPMTSIIPLIEESYSDNTKVNISLADLNKKNSILKRTKPLPNSKNTLFETLGIKETNK